MIKILIPIVSGSEDIEVVALTDILRRGSCEVTLASLEEREVLLSRGVRIIADALWEDIKNQEFDAIICPGGPGTPKLQLHSGLKEKMLKQAQNNWFGAICAAPNLTLNEWGLLNSRKATAFPGHFEKLPNPSSERVVVDQKCITSIAAGSTEEFALTWLHYLLSPEKAEEIRKQIVAR